jgi:hypothetical protein
VDVQFEQKLRFLNGIKVSRIHCSVVSYFILAKSQLGEREGEGTRIEKVQPTCSLSVSMVASITIQILVSYDIKILPN